MWKEKGQAEPRCEPIETHVNRCQTMCRLPPLYQHPFAADSALPLCKLTWVAIDAPLRHMDIPVELPTQTRCTLRIDEMPLQCRVGWIMHGMRKGCNDQRACMPMHVGHQPEIVRKGSGSPTEEHLTTIGNQAAGGVRPPVVVENARHDRVGTWRICVLCTYVSVMFRLVSNPRLLTSIVLNEINGG